jgi:hypothetical protein
MSKDKERDGLNQLKAVALARKSGLSSQWQAYLLAMIVIVSWSSLTFAQTGTGYAGTSSIDIKTLVENTIRVAFVEFRPPIIAIGAIYGVFLLFSNNPQSRGNLAKLGVAMAAYLMGGYIINLAISTIGQLQ